MKKTAHIFDSYALLKLFSKEKGYEKISRLLEDIKKAGSVKYINAINLGEIIYTTKREFGDQKKLGGACKHREAEFYDFTGAEQPDIRGSRV